MSFGVVSSQIGVHMFQQMILFFPNFLGLKTATHHEQFKKLCRKYLTVCLYTYRKLYTREFIRKSIPSSRHQSNKFVLFKDFQLLLGGFFPVLFNRKTVNPFFSCLTQIRLAFLRVIFSGEWGEGFNCSPSMFQEELIQ